MTESIPNIDLKQIDKSNWQSYRFDQIAQNVSERVDPNNTDLKVYVGLEHIDSENIHIKRTGNPADVDGQKLRCYPGDIIFGRRRAYQRKAAIATFDGFCSAHALVLRAKPEVIHPRLFPFFLHSDAFMHRAIDISVGSLSPTINWGTLKAQEFLLPPKDQQAQLAELLWAMDEVVEKEMELQINLIELKNSYLRRIRAKYFEMTLPAESTEHASKARVDSFFKLQRGFDLTKKDAIEGEIPVISSSGLSYFHNSSKCDGPGVITGRKGKLGDVYFLEGPHWPHDTTLWVKDFGNNYPKFIFWFLKSINLESFNAATAVPTLNRNVIHPIIVCFPDFENQKIISKKLDELESRLILVESKLAASRALQKSLINQIF